MARTVRIDDLSFDPRLQMRAKLSQDAIKRYAETPAKLPKVQTVTDEDGKEWVWDGHHTVEAYKYRGLKEVPVESRSGTFDDALELAAGANATHGLPLTQEDKKRKVKTILAEPKWKDASSRAIADLCMVSHHFVEKIRTGESGNNPKSSQRTASDGTRAARPPRKPKPPKPSVPDTTATHGFQMCKRCANIGAPSCDKCRNKHLAAQAKKKVEEEFDFTVVYAALQTLRAQKKKFTKQHGLKDSPHADAIENGVHELRVTFRTWYRETTNQKPPEE